MNSNKILRNAKKIAIVRTDKLGDMVLTLPMVNIIKSINPYAEIHVIANSYTEFLLQNQPYISAYHFVNKVDGGINSIFKNNKFDVVFFPRPRLEEVFPAFVNRVPLRVGSGYRYYSFLFNKKIFEHRKTAEKTEAQYNVDMINSIAGTNEEYKLLKPYISNNAIQKITQLTKNIGKYIVIHPGGSGSAPYLSKEKFSEIANYILANKLKENSKFLVVVTGVENELNLCNYICENNPQAINLCGKLSLEETSALLSTTECLIANSTGIMHIAEAIGSKVIALFPSAKAISSDRWGHKNPRTINLTSKEQINFEKDQAEMELNIDTKEIISALVHLLF